MIYTRRRHALYGERIEIDLNNIMYDYAANFVEENRGIEFEDFRMELIREVAVEPQIDEATYKDAKPGELVEAIVKALKEAYARRAKAVADTVRPVMERIYEDRKDQLDSNIYFPLTDGHLGYNVPVNLRKCQSSDGAEIYKVFSKVVMFTTIDDAWREHLREMDDQFHDIICDMSGHAVISDTLVPLHRKTRRYRKASIADAKRTAQVVKEHRAIYEAIAAGDADAAAVQCHHSYLEALALFSQQVFFRNDTVLEDELAGRGCTDAHFLLMLADGESSAHICCTAT